MTISKKPYRRDRGTVFLEEVDRRNLKEDVEELQRTTRQQFDDLKGATREELMELLLRVKEVELHNHWEQERAYLGERERDRVKAERLEERSRWLIGALVVVLLVVIGILLVLVIGG